MWLFSRSRLCKHFKWFRISWSYFPFAMDIFPLLFILFIFLLYLAFCYLIPNSSFYSGSFISLQIPVFGTLFAFHSNVVVFYFDLFFPNVSFYPGSIHLSRACHFISGFFLIHCLFWDFARFPNWFFCPSLCYSFFLSVGVYFIADFILIIFFVV